MLTDSLVKYGAIFNCFIISKGTHYSGGPTVRKSGYDERILLIIIITCIIRLWNHFDNF